MEKFSNYSQLCCMEYIEIVNMYTEQGNAELCDQKYVNTKNVTWTVVRLNTRISSHRWILLRN